MLPLRIAEGALPFGNGDYLFLPKIREAVANGDREIKAWVVRNEEIWEFVLTMDPLTEDEKEIILKGCLINYYRG